MDTFIKVAASRRTALILRATAAQLRAEAKVLQLAAARTADEGERRRTQPNNGADLA